MSVVTGIENIRGKRGYRRVTFDDSSEVELDGELMRFFGIREGAEYDDTEIKRIKHFSARKIAKDKALEILKYRSKSENELRRKLAGKKIRRDIIDEVLADLSRVGIINDHEFAMRFSRDFISRKPAGEFLLKMELKKKGIKEEIIDDTVETIYSKLDKRELILKLIQKKKFNPGTSDQKEKKRMYDFLLRRGFSWELIGEVMGN
ncbi:regulatory protein RecX [candidate division KSB1 bacterium]